MTSNLHVYVITATIFDIVSTVCAWVITSTVLMIWNQLYFWDHTRYSSQHHIDCIRNDTQCMTSQPLLSWYQIPYISHHLQDLWHVLPYSCDITDTMFGNLRLKETPRAVESSHYWNMLGRDWNLLLHEIPDAIGANWCWGKLRACIHESLLGIWFQESQLVHWWVGILGPLEMPKSVRARRCQSALRALVHGSVWKHGDKEASWRERITCGHQSPGTAGTGRFPGRELNSKGPSNNLEPKNCLK